MKVIKAKLFFCHSFSDLISFSIQSKDSSYYHKENDNTYWYGVAQNAVIGQGT
jgi:hypothetical protein